MFFNRLLDPLLRKPLLFTQIGPDSDFGYLSCEESTIEWPVAFGISYLRFDRIELAQSVVLLLKNNDFIGATALLLQDTDDFAPIKPQLEDCRKMAERMLNNDTSLLAIEIMESCKFGPVADYFSIRGSTPTYLSGLSLLKLGLVPSHPLIEIGCGVGHFLYWLRKRKINILGTDTVFCKLYIAKRFFNIPSDSLICASAGTQTQLPLETFQPTNVFCHDVFYFIKNKTEAIADFRRVAGRGGNIIIGHAHLSTADHGIVSGYPLLLEEYKEIASKEAHFYDDASLVNYQLINQSMSDEVTAEVEAISFIEGALNENNDCWWKCDDETLFAPMGVTFSNTKGLSQMNWPSQAFETEYKSSNYLISPVNPFEYLPFCGDESLLPLNEGLAIPEPFLSLGLRPLKWGIVGGGWIAKDYFEPAFKFVPHAKLVAVCDTNPKRLAFFANDVNIQTFSDLHDMLSVCSLDAIYISTPNYYHAEICAEIAKYGVRVLCEKPLATSLGDLSKIEKSTQYQPTFFQTAFDQRYHPAHIRLARAIAQGALGKVTQIRIFYACWVDDKWEKTSSTENWRIDFEQAGGGAGFDLLPHCLDLALMLVNDSVADAQLMYQNLVHNYSINKQVDDGALLSIKTVNGILVSMHVGYNCPENLPRRRIEVMGTQGFVQAHNTMGQDAGGELVWNLNGHETREVFAENLESGPFVRQLDALTRLWLRGDEPKYPIENDIKLAKILINCDSIAKKT